MKYLLCFFLLGLQTHSSQAVTYYVSPTGNDSDKGTNTDPLQTIGEGAKRAQPGDVVLVLEGLYRERIAPPRGGELGRPISYRAQRGARVVVKGSEVWTPDWQEEGTGIYSARPDDQLFQDRSEEYLDHYNPFKVQLSSTPWHRQGLREEERRKAGDDRIGRADKRIVYTCGQVFVNDQQFLEVPLREELKAECWWYDEATDRIWLHFGDRKPSEQQVEITTRRRIFAPHRRGLGHIVVEGFVFEHCGNQYPTNFWENDANAQKGAVGTEAGHHWTIRRNVVRHAKTFAIDAGSVDRHSRSEQVVGNVIEQNYIIDNGSAGILSNGSRNLVIRDNVILRNNQLRFLGVKRWEQAGVKCHHFRDGLIERNYIAENYDTYGIWLDNQFPNCRVSKNLIVGNGRAGIFLEMSDYDFDSLLIDHNIVLNNKENAVYIHDASGATFVHNLLANTDDSEGRGQAVYIRQATARTKTYHHSFYGNLLVGNARNVEVNYPAGRSGIQRFDGNVYAIEKDARRFVINSASDKPSPWNRDEFERLMHKDLSDDVDGWALDSQGHAALTLEQWRSFWRSHGVDNEKQSQVLTDMSVNYSVDTQKLSIRFDGTLKVVSVRQYEPIDTDYLNLPISDQGRVLPGPFQSLSTGTTEVDVWSGLPAIDAGELPSPEWTVD